MHIPYQRPELPFYTLRRQKYQIYQIQMNNNHQGSQNILLHIVIWSQCAESFGVHSHCCHICDLHTDLISFAFKGDANLLTQQQNVTQNCGYINLWDSKFFSFFFQSWHMHHQCNLPKNPPTAYPPTLPSHSAFKALLHSQRNYVIASTLPLGREGTKWMGRSRTGAQYEHQWDFIAMSQPTRLHQLIMNTTEEQCYFSKKPLLWKCTYQSLGTPVRATYKDKNEHYDVFVIVRTFHPMCGRIVSYC